MGRTVRFDNDVIKTNVTDVDDGWKQVRAEEISSRAELCQPGHQNQREL